MQITRRLIALFPLATIAFVIACSASTAPQSESDAGADSGSPGFGGAVDASNASIATKANAILGTCSGGPESNCHGSSSSAGGMHLPDVPPNLVNVPSTEEPQFVRVLPGNPEQSYLYMKVTNDPRIIGARMPNGLPALDATDLATLHDWIEAGAPSP